MFSATVPKVSVAIQRNGEGDRGRGPLFLLLGCRAAGFPQLPSVLAANPREGQTRKALGTQSRVAAK